MVCVCVCVCVHARALLVSVSFRCTARRSRVSSCLWVCGWGGGAWAGCACRASGLAFANVLYYLTGLESYGK